jgi:hypothetical protein
VFWRVMSHTFEMLLNDWSWWRWKISDYWVFKLIKENILNQ